MREALVALHDKEELAAEDGPRLAELSLEYAQLMEGLGLAAGAEAAQLRDNARALREALGLAL